MSGKCTKWNIAAVTFRVIYANGFIRRQKATELDAYRVEISKKQMMLNCWPKAKVRINPITNSNTL
jgi:hypothetical protein